MFVRSVFQGQSSLTRKLKLGETPTHWYFTCKAIDGCGFLITILLRAKMKFSILAVEHKHHHNLGASWAERNFLWSKRCAIQMWN